LNFPVRHAVPFENRSFTGLCLAAGLWALLLSTAPLSAAPPIVLGGLGGGQWSEAELERGTTIVVVWASWSPRCRDIVPRVNALDRRWASQARIVTVVFQEEPAKIERFLAGQSLRAPVYLDAAGDFSKKHAVTTLPGLLVFKGGQRLYDGKLPPDADSLLERLLD